MVSTSSNPAYLHARKQTMERSLVTEREYQKSSNQLSSGGQNMDYSDVCDVKVFVGQEILLEQDTKYEQGNTYNEHRLNTLSTHLDRLHAITIDLQQQISQARSNASPLTAGQLQQWAKGRLQQVEKLLNAKFGEESLLSGSNTLTKAVGSLDNPLVTPGGTVTKGYFLGDNEDTSFQSDSYTSIVNKVNASSNGIAEMIYALNLCVYHSNDIAALGRANDLTLSAGQDINVDINQVGLQLKKLKESQVGLGTEKTQAEALIQKEGYKPPAEAFNDFINAAILNQLNQTLATRNDSLRTLMESL